MTIDDILSQLDWQAREDVRAQLRRTSRLKSLDSSCLYLEPSVHEQDAAEVDFGKRVLGYLHLLRTQEKFIDFWLKWVTRLSESAIHDPTEAMAMAVAFKIHITPT
jgi:hypothetical protein